MSVKYRPRADDDRDLLLLELRCFGCTSVQIEARTGIARTLVRTITNRIKADDLAHCDLAEARDAARVYW